MARPTVDPNVKVGTVLHTPRYDVVVRRVLKHAYEVTTLDGHPHAEVWSFEVHYKNGRYVTQYTPAAEAIARKEK